jgi:hypothetical protein
MMDARDNLVCCCSHPFRDHVLRHIKGHHGSIGGACLMAGCGCSEFRLAPGQIEGMSADLHRVLEKAGRVINAGII